MGCEVVAYADNGEARPLSLECEVSGVTWETGWGTQQPDGCQEAQFQVAWDPRDASPLVGIGRRVEIWDGPAVPYVGTITDIQPGDRWTITAWGLGSLASNCLCLDGSSNPTSVPDTAYDQALARAGLPWAARSSSISSVAFSGATSTTVFNKLSTLLSDYAASVGKRWAVWPGLTPGAPGQFVLAADPTTPDYLLLPSSGVVGVADRDFVTHVYGRYVSATTGAPPVPSSWATVTAANAATAAEFGRREEGMDLTVLGLLTAPKAQAMVDGKIGLLGARMGWTNGFDATPLELVRPGGAPARLALVRAGEMVRICNVVDAYGQLLPGVTMDVVIGRTKYADGAESIGITPVGLVERDLLGLLSVSDPAEFVAA